MASIRESTEWVRNKKLIFYIVSFLSFWIALLLQSYIAKFWADKVSVNFLNITTIASMWLLATFILPIIGSILVVYFLIKYKSS